MPLLDFEKPVADLEKELGKLSPTADAERLSLTKKRNEILSRIYSHLTPWQKAQVARHLARPHFRTIADALFTDFTPLAGDRAFADDPALLGGPARFAGRPVMLIGHEKGSDTKGRVKHNFGMAKPEGYRKAARLMAMAGRFHMPILSFIDTPGAFPGIDAEERGQAEAIARATEACLKAPVPMVAVIVGEGGSGGAMGIAAANRVLMLEHAIYSVISPEGCASILWRDAGRAAEAARAMHITAADLLTLNVIDGIIPEPVGGAHRAPELAIATIGHYIGAMLDELAPLSATELVASRRQRFLAVARATIAEEPTKEYGAS